MSRRRRRSPPRLWSHRYPGPDTGARDALPRRRSFSSAALTRQPVAKRTGPWTIVRAGVVTLARTSDVLPRCTSHKTSVSLDNDGGDEHQRHPNESQENRAGETEDQDHQTGHETGDAPTNTASTVGVHVRLTNVLGESWILFRE